MRILFYIIATLIFVTIGNGNVFASEGSYKVVVGDKTYQGQNTCTFRHGGSVSFDSVKGSNKSMQVHGSGKPDKEYMIYVVDNETSYEGYSKEYKINKNGGSGSLSVIKAGTRDETPTTFEFTCK